MLNQFYQLVIDAVNRYPKHYDNEGNLINNRPNSFAILDEWECIKSEDLGKRYEDRDVYHFFSRKWGMKGFPANIEVEYPLVYAIELDSIINIQNRTIEREIDFGVLWKMDEKSKRNKWEADRILDRILYNIFYYVKTVNYYANDATGIWLLPHEYKGIDMDLKIDQFVSYYFTDVVNNDLQIFHGDIRGVDDMIVARTTLNISEFCIPAPQFEEEQCFELTPKPCCS